MLRDATAQSCHGREGRGGPKGSAITNDSFLALVSDQGCARSSSRAVPSWARPTGAGTAAASRCRTRKSPTSLRGSPRTGSQSPGQPYSAANDAQH